LLLALQEKQVNKKGLHQKDNNELGLVPVFLKLEPWHFYKPNKQARVLSLPNG